MALTRDQKAKLMDIYQGKIDEASNVVLVEQRGIPVNAINEVRKAMEDTGGQMLVAKKRLFLQSSVKAGCDATDLQKSEGHLTVLFAGEDEFAPLKAIYKINNEFKKKKAKYGFTYIGGWYDKVWKDATFVEEMAALPSKEELVGKFLFLLKYPVQSFTAVLNQIKDKVSDWSEVTAPVATEAKAEDVVEEVKAEEEVKEDATDETPVVSEETSETSEESKE